MAAPSLGLCHCFFAQVTWDPVAAQARLAASQARLPPPADESRGRLSAPPKEPAFSCPGGIGSSAASSDPLEDEVLEDEIVEGEVVPKRARTSSSPVPLLPVDASPPERSGLAACADGVLARRRHCGHGLKGASPAPS